MVKVHICLCAYFAQKKTKIIKEHEEFLNKAKENVFIHNKNKDIEMTTTTLVRIS